MLKERIYPFCIALILTLLAMYFKINYIDNDKLFDALNGILTITTLIIGFWGAIFPVILNAKNDMATVKRVFEIDENGLYSKYMNSVLQSGILLIIVTVTAYFRDSFIETIYYKYIFYILLFLFTLFICTTYRFINITINLIFLPDAKQGDYSTPKKTEITKIVEEELKKEKDNK